MGRRHTPKPARSTMWYSSPPRTTAFTPSMPTENSPVANASPLWRVTLLDAAHGAAPGARVMYSTDISNQVDRRSDHRHHQHSGDRPSHRHTLRGRKKQKEGNAYVQRLHALSITNGAEKIRRPP